LSSFSSIGFKQTSFNTSQSALSKSSKLIPSFNFPDIINALKNINYQGMISIEAFSTKLSAANIWRKMFNSESELMYDSFNYLKQIS
jgi:hypothetical protein